MRDSDDESRAAWADKRKQRNPQYRIPWDCTHWTSSSHWKKSMEPSISDTSRLSTLNIAKISHKCMQKPHNTHKIRIRTQNPHNLRKIISRIRTKNSHNVRKRKAVYVRKRRTTWAKAVHKHTKKTQMYAKSVNVCKRRKCTQKPQMYAKPYPALRK